MPSASFETNGGVLIVTGSLDRAGDQELQSQLDRYCKDPAAPEKVLDMSNVRWLTPSGAKVIIQAGQDLQDKGNKLRVIASRHVNQTLALLGAKSWLQIENAIAPPKGETGKTAEEPPPPSLTDSQKKIVLNAAPAAEAPPAAVAAAPAPSVAVAPAPAAPAAPAAPPASVSGVMQAITRTGALASPIEELSGGAHLLRILFPNRRYSFHFANGNDIIGVVRERIGGSWVLVETQSTRKIVNLDVVEYCEIL